MLWYTKHVNKLNTGTGVSTEVTLPSGFGVKRCVALNSVTFIFAFLSTDYLTDISLEKIFLRWYIKNAAPIAIHIASIR